jgi:hypothetical protein
VRTLRSFLLLSGLATVTSAAQPSRAAGHASHPLLVVHRTEDASDCPDARTLAALVADQMKHPALDAAFDLPPGSDSGLDVQIYRSGQGFTAVIQAGGKTRQLTDNGANCAGLAGALAVSIAVILDTEPPPPPPEPPPATSPRARVSHPAPTPEPPEVPLHDTDAEPPPPRVRISLAAAPVLTVGILQGFAGGITSEVEARIGRFIVAGGVLALPGQSFAFQGGQVSLDMTAGILRGCGIVAGDEPLRFVLCLDPMAGTVRGNGTGFSSNRSATLPWASLATSALFQQRIWGRLSWGARSELVIPLVKTSFLSDNGATAFAAAPVGGAWNIELRVSIW